ncbi:MAG: hypothetical protein QOH93_2100 [Chloroflexia bacterium]|nr:hypothetical protein [Chloroflexia bacterium]
MSRFQNDSDGLDSFEDFEDIGISVMEELDPEPQPKSGSVYAREFFIGIVLVLAVLAFAGWQWWQTEYRQSNYRLGEQAARQFDWDAASARFSAADGYRDAGKRAEAAANRVRERDEHYGVGLEHFNSGEWAAALKELRTVREVQPGYRDVGPMEAKAEQQVYKDALLGSVVMRPEAEPPGLYYRSESGWVWLKGSDTQSTPWGQGTPDHVLYDAPIEGWIPPAVQSRRPSSSDLDEHRRVIAGRRLMVATPGTGGVPGVGFWELPLNLSDYDWFEWNQDGVWGIQLWDPRSAARAGQVLVDPSPVREKISNIQQITYHAFGTRSMRSTNPTYYGMNVALMDYNRNGDGLLVANWTKHEDGTFTVDLYLNSLAKGENKLLYSHNGGFVKASFSANSRYVFLTTYKPIVGMLEDHTLLMIDTTGVEPVRVLSEQKGIKAINGVVIDSNQYPIDTEQYANARLLEGGPYAGKVLVTQWISYTNYVSVLSLDGGPTIVTTAAISNTGRVSWDVVSTDNSGLLLWGVGSVNAASPPFPDIQTLVGVRFSPGQPPMVARQPIARRSAVAAIQQRGSELIYLAYDYNRQGLQGAVELYAVDSSEIDLGEIPVKSLYRYELPRGSDPRTLPGRDFAFTFGPGMFAYLDQNTIRAVTYDGEVNLPLEDGITHLFNMDFASP